MRFFVIDSYPHFRRIYVDKDYIFRPDTPEYVTRVLQKGQFGAMTEAFFESMPQALLQGYIILHTGVISRKKEKKC
jgi:hypothetical protein